MGAAVAASQLLYPERLLVLPTYRDKVTLTLAGVSLDILGGTQVELLAERSGEPRQASESCSAAW